MTHRGRPMKYTEFIKALRMDKAYSVSHVVKHGEERGFFELEEYRAEKEPLDEAMGRVRKAIYRLATHQLPSREDALISEPGQAPQRAWCGWRWKSAIPEFFLDEKDLAEIRECEARFLISQHEPVQPEEKPQGVGFFSFRGPRLTLALFFATIVLSVGFIAVFYPEGARLFKEEGPSAALDYFRHLEGWKRGDPAVVFGKAWSKYAIGNFDEAEKDTYRLIQDSRTPEVTLGNCFFLLGKIKTRTGLHQEAREFYQRAQSIYEALNRPANIFKNYIGLAELALETGDLFEAENIIQEALEIRREARMEPWDLFHLQAELEFKRSDYHRALEFSYRYYSGYKNAGNLGKTADALIDIGFYLILTGQMGAGFEKTMAAQVLINKAGDQNKFYFGLINQLLLRRCEGKSYAGIEENLINHIDETGDQRLQNLLVFALNYPCGTGPEEGGEGDEDPPPND